MLWELGGATNYRCNVRILMKKSLIYRWGKKNSTHLHLLIKVAIHLIYATAPASLTAQNQRLFLPAFGPEGLILQQVSSAMPTECASESVLCIQSR